MFSENKVVTTRDRLIAMMIVQSLRIYLYIFSRMDCYGNESKFPSKIVYNTTLIWDKIAARTSQAVLQRTTFGLEHGPRRFTGPRLIQRQFLRFGGAGLVDRGFGRFDRGQLQFQGINFALIHRAALFLLLP